MLKDLNVTIIQSDIHWENKHKNLENFTDKINITSLTDVIILPEMFTTGFTMNTSLAETMDDKTVSWMKLISKNFYLMGSIIIKENEKFYNRFLSVKSDNIEYYDKRHLFAFAGENKFYTAGFDRKIVSINGWRILLQTCYDLRFPVFSRNKNDYDAIVYIASWPSKRSQHWKSLLQARSIENQAYVIGVNRVGIDGLNIEYSGDSSVYDPLGNLIYQCSNFSDISTITLKGEQIEFVRNTFKFLDDADNFEIKKNL